MFIHTLDIIPQNWYIQLELRQDTISWVYLTTKFVTTFSTYDENAMVNTALQLIKEKVLEGVEESKDLLPDWVMFAKQVVECYKLEESRLEEDEPREVHILEAVGERVVEGLYIISDYSKP